MNTIYCWCAQTFQDERYGKGQRVWTPIGKSGRGAKFSKVRCTGCGRETDAPKGASGVDDRDEIKKGKGAVKVEEKAPKLNQKK